MRGLVILLCCLPPVTWAAEKPLTLQEALATADALHPDLSIAESDLAVSLADRDQADSRQNFNLFLDGGLRTGRQPGGEWAADNVARVVARKPLLDFGRTAQNLAAAEQEVSARRTALLDARAPRAFVHFKKQKNTFFVFFFNRLQFSLHVA